jgi:hypothetical protein
LLAHARAQTDTPKSSQSKRQQPRRRLLKAKKKKRKELGRRGWVKLPGFELTTEIIFWFFSFCSKSLFISKIRLIFQQ